MKKYKSRASEAAHGIAKSLKKVGAISADRMKYYDKQCLIVPPLLAPEQIREIRDKTGTSQSEFAQLLNVTTSTISKWERGEKKPVGIALRLLQIVEAKGIEVLYC